MMNLIFFFSLLKNNNFLSFLFFWFLHTTRTPVATCFMCDTSDPIILLVCYFNSLDSANGRNSHSFACSQGNTYNHSFSKSRHACSWSIRIIIHLPGQPAFLVTTIATTVFSPHHHLLSSSPSLAPPWSHHQVNLSSSFFFCFSFSHPPLFCNWRVNYNSFSTIHL
jgi:hypothetical protein